MLNISKLSTNAGWQMWKWNFQNLHNGSRTSMNNIYIYIGIFTNNLGQKYSHFILGAGGFHVHLQLLLGYWIDRAEVPGWTQIVSQGCRREQQLSHVSTYLITLSDRIWTSLYLPSMFLTSSTRLVRFFLASTICLREEKLVSMWLNCWW